jgi:hypothetical protein
MLSDFGALGMLRHQGDARKMDELFPMNELYKSTRELQSPTPL